MTLRATEVFTPGSYPEHTYVHRAEQGFEVSLRDSLDTPGQIVSISGPSKSGKTVLVEKVVGKDSLIPITGASIRKPEDVWTLILDWMDVPDSRSIGNSTGKEIGAETTAKGGVSLSFFAKAEVSATGRVGATADATTGATRQRRGLQQVVDEIGGSDFVILIDDFHYMDRLIQTEVAKGLKEAVRLGVKIVTAAVTHRGDDVLRANPELRGRVRAIDLKYWTDAELEAIASTGFGALNAVLTPSSLKKFTKESAGSPQLMQLLCLESCFVADLRTKHTGITPRELSVDRTNQSRVLEQTSTRTDFRSLVDVLDSGPPTRGTERSTFKFLDGTVGDVYRAVLKSIASDPPQLSFTYDELLARTTAVCKGDSPVGSSVTSTCVQMSKLAFEKFPNERAIDWDESKRVLDIPDPYLMFYLRWSERLQNEQR